ncbi:MAG TPA: hypothetical protein PLQ20_03055 [Candidatus Paceibacterota bacterium]|nr:hypothetical protein [Candidatus Paceibacterota bacterium]
MEKKGNGLEKIIREIQENKNGIELVKCLCRHSEGTIPINNEGPVVPKESCLITFSNGEKPIGSFDFKGVEIYHHPQYKRSTLNLSKEQTGSIPIRIVINWIEPLKVGECIIRLRKEWE